MARFSVKPGDRIPAALPHDTIVLQKGDWSATTIRNLRGTPGAPIRIEAESKHAAVFRGGSNAIRIMDGNAWLTFWGIRTTESVRGVNATMSPGLRFEECLADRNCVEGFKAGGCDDIVFQDCEARDNGRGGVDGYDLHQGHGFYVSWGSKRPRLTRCRATGNKGSALQFNGTPHELPDGECLIVAPRIEDFFARGNGTDGTPAISLMATRDGQYLRLDLEDNNAGIVLFDDEAGRKGQCINNTFTACRIVGGKWCVRAINRTLKTTFVDSTIACQAGAPVYQERGLKVPAWRWSDEITLQNTRVYGAAQWSEFTGQTPAPTAPTPVPPLVLSATCPRCGNQHTCKEA